MMRDKRRNYNASRQEPSDVKRYVFKTDAQKNARDHTLELQKKDKDTWDKTPISLQLEYRDAPGIFIISSIIPLGSF